jgi:hypothetical protein
LSAGGRYCRRWPPSCRRADVLNSAQRAAITVGLRAFEMHLHEIERWLRGEKASGVLFWEHLDVSDEVRVQAGEQVAAALTLVAELARRFELERTSIDLGAKITGLMSVDWADLVDLQASKLRRYGEVAVELSGLLDDDLQRLADMAKELAKLRGATRG